MTTKEMFKVELRDLVLLGFVVAIKIVLSRFTIGTTIVHIGLGFIGSVLLGYMFGPVWGAVGGGISDLVSSALFANQGGFFIGFTLSAMVGPLIYGLILYKKPVKIWRIILATLLVTVIVNLGMNTLWLHFLYGMDFKVALIQRVPKEAIAPWLEMIITYFVLRALSRVKIRR
ncbi:folate family ECF transporter S component [Lactobacillus panisapium]|uniref:Folate family ECF transporter S component n=1 Tax=Lactobacillus panisapium TaxID=2012495 RepID=A0ABX8W6X4_9LACO|nr:MULTISPECIES: folate family ECF transporter S component [Lactobacillus]MCO6532469.1 folate family ECF transporter S component [Lactobacillus sp.]MCO6536221.1 folate family ECF transporter S component [Lactobacillus sp.]MCX8723212.1 folate family ECF transporter S component [Lactobacillus sp. B4005]MCX8737384.1 folate family ECF transporter S component [Lactobacillus sp. B4026]QYN53227.1 folate family ECF transporter S component [Lactobacillus panisapium]